LRRVRRRLHRLLRRGASLAELRQALSVPLAARAEAFPERTAIGAGNRLESLTVTGRARELATLSVGDQCDLEGRWVIHEPTASIAIGSRSELNAGCVIDCVERVEIGDDVLVAAEVYIADHDSHSADWRVRRHDHLARREGRRDWSVVPRAPVRIESKAWIGRRAMIFKGVTVGEGAIVAAGSVVTQPVEPWTLAAGVPARAIRKVGPPPKTDEA
jgi:acetyltransferase-like isoleucine patch superfamily enzyme